MSDRAATRTISCATSAVVDRQRRRASSRTRSREPRLAAPSRPRRRPRRPARPGRRPARRRASRSARRCPPSRDAHRVELRERLRRPRASTRVAESAGSRARRLGRLLADRQRLRQPQQIARRQRAGDEPRCARAGRAPPRAPSANASFSSTSSAGDLPQLHADAQLHAPARHALLHERAEPRSRSLASDCGSRSCRSRKR